MSENKSLFKTFELIRLLNTTPKKSVKNLERQLGMSNSAVHRRILLLNSIGYPISKDKQHRYFLDFDLGADSNSPFTKSELELLNGLLQDYSGKSPEATNIIHKLQLNRSLIPLADALPQLHASKLLNLSRIAINLRCQMKILRYRSLTSNDVTDRLVEPMELTADRRYLIGWDVEKGEQRQFKIDRIGDVEVLNTKMVEERIASPIDLFGMTGDSWETVRLELDGMAHHLLLEEFPASRGCVRNTARGWVEFTGQVRSWKGVGRFVLGLPGRVKVITPQAFKDYIQKKVSEF